MKLATENSCTSIGFPLISAGLFGFPVENAWKIALQACTDYIERGNQIDIVFAVLTDSIFELGQKTLKIVAPYLKIATKSDWKVLDMPEKKETFVLHRLFSEKEMQELRKGYIPQSMDDKWFFYMKGNVLYAYRSWSAFCIYIIEFSVTNCHKVIVNRDDNQYTNKSIDYDRKGLNCLLDWWSSAQCHTYHGESFEFISSPK